MPALILAGVDSSTQETKVLIVRGEDGAVLASGRRPHTVRGSGGTRVADPEGWWQALRGALADTGMAGEVDAIAVAAQQHGLVTLDAHGRPLSPAPLWNDTTAAPDARALLEDLGGREGWAHAVGSVPLAAFTVAKWARLRRTEPDVAATVRGVRLPHEYLTERLCGAAIGDRGDASGTGWFSPRQGCYAEEVLALSRVGLDPGQLSDVRHGCDPAGELTAAAARELGLAAGTLVAAGTGDNMAAAAGLGLHSGEAALSLGTSGTVYARTELPSEDPTGVIAGFADAADGFLPLACTLNATLAIDRFAAWLGIDREAVEPAGGVVVLPYLDGERTPDLPDATATITGLRHDTRPGQVLQAAYDGAVEALMLGLELLEGPSGGRLDPEAPLLLLGGGAQGRAWRETVARLSGRTLLVPDRRELVAHGAAALAAAAARGGDPAVLAREWGARAGTTVPQVPREQDRLLEIRAARDRLLS